MKRKNLKIFNLLLIAILTLFLGVNVNAAVSRLVPTFSYDPTFTLRLGDELTATTDADGNPAYKVPIIIDYTTVINLSESQDDEEIVYSYVELTETEYNEILNDYQNEIDKYLTQADKTGVANLTVAFSEYIEAHDGTASDEDWWCVSKLLTGAIYLPRDCTTRYYIVMVDAYDNDTLINDDYNWEFQTARVYKVEADTTLDSCPTDDTTPDDETPDDETPDDDTPEEDEPIENDPKGDEEPEEDEPETENPKTGLTTPYIVCGVLVIGSIAAIIISKQEKFM